ncbi:MULTISPECIES: FecCD family ABC transporter permease [Marinobacter]|uniref:FecCD family ABC transporter permease n=1 Tax=Marinobacter TaxID=2742 RepID=UPI001D083222|nr:iron ABC transporter permease [Marinobacter sp. CA1]MCK7566729.1 iron ABC transporter permease [Marinobacter xestospongiae]UDL05624.1 iron ABC transporter permease [Marinobacter sp. CA1]
MELDNRELSCRATVLALFCLLLAAAATLISLAWGERWLAPQQVLQALRDSGDGVDGFVVQQLRLPRAVTAVLVGAALGMAGTLVQSITRNPLGTPDLMGVSAGASFAIVLGYLVLGLPPATLLPLGTAGGFAAGLLTFAVAWQTRLNPTYLLLAGMSIALFFFAAITLLLVTADTGANGIYYWLTGSLMNRTWDHVHQLYPLVVPGLVLGMAFARVLDLLTLDELTTAAVGLPVQRWRLVLGLLAVVLTAATVAVAGPIGFVGLVAPHLVRLALRRSAGGALPHRWLLPLSALTGAALVALADCVARLVGVPVGILCVLLGGPLLVLLVRRQGGAG